MCGVLYWTTCSCAHDSEFLEYRNHMFMRSWLKQVSWRLHVRQPSYSRFFHWSTQHERSIICKTSSMGGQFTVYKGQALFVPVTERHGVYLLYPASLIVSSCRFMITMDIYNKETGLTLTVTTQPHTWHLDSLTCTCTIHKGKSESPFFRIKSHSACHS